MTTTSLKLPDELKARATLAAQNCGVSTHAFLINAIYQTVDAAERRAQFVSDAVTAREQSLASGKGHAASDVHDYLRNKTQNQPATRPKATTWHE